ncbi:hypothetical protein BJY52DRAFT_1284454 [Lactarius psammicola]|nr:hypothetical protein BJY52DRAFT_1284454 [Lactarius psammicola]
MSKALRCCGRVVVCGCGLGISLCPPYLVPRYMRPFQWERKGHHPCLCPGQSRRNLTLDVTCFLFGAQDSLSSGMMVSKSTMRTTPPTRGALTSYQGLKRRLLSSRVLEAFCVLEFELPYEIFHLETEHMTIVHVAVFLNRTPRLRTPSECRLNLMRSWRRSASKMSCEPSWTKFGEVS